MPFVATANPPAAAQEPLIENDGFFPAMDPAQVRAACRLDGSVTPDRLAPALQAAMLSVNAELGALRERQQGLGRKTLAEVPASMLAGESAHVLRYRRAVHECLLADLAEAYRAISSVPDVMGKNVPPLTALVTQIDEHRRNQRWAISDLLGIARSTVELI